MKIGLVITAYNRPDELQQTLDYLSQSFFPKNFEIYIVDDYSSNLKTLELIKGFTLPNINIQKIRNNENKSMFYGLRIGFEYFYERGFDVLVNLDSDVLVKPYWINVLFKLYKQFPDRIISGFNTLKHPIIETFQRYHTKWTIGGINMMFGRKLCPLVCSVLLTNRWDWQLCIEMHKLNKELIVAKPSVIQHTSKYSVIGHNTPTPDRALDWSVPYFAQHRFVNYYFDKVFCINLNRRIDRWKHCKKEFEKHKLIVERIEAVDAENIKDNTTKWMSAPRIACCLSHAKVLHMMKEQNLNRILVLEDDVQFIDNFQEIFNDKIQYVPEYYDILYLCGNTPKNLEIINGHVAKTTSVLSTVAYAITADFAKIILPKIEMLKDPVDCVYAANTCNFNCYIFKPYLCKQRPGFSDIEKKFKDYSEFMDISVKAAEPKPTPRLVKTVTCASLGKFGRLGNQMFQIAAVLGYANKHHLKAVFPKWYCDYTQKDMSVYFKNKINQSLSISSQCEREYKESNFYYSEIPYYSSVDLYGYFQSEKYFSNKYFIKHYFEPSELLLKSIYEKYEEWLQKETCSIHVRCGDYINHSLHDVCDTQYYEKAIKFVKSQKNIDAFVVFSDNIELCKKKFPSSFIFIENSLNSFGLKSIYKQNNSDVEELFLMSLCKHNIIANSSFSWWGAWLNNNSTKIVVSPQRWFLPTAGKEDKDVYTEDMVKI